MSAFRSRCGSSWVSPQTVVGEGDERRVLLGDEQLLQIVVGPLEVAEIGVESLVVLEERFADVGAVVDGTEIRPHQPPQPHDERFGEALVGGDGPPDPHNQVGRPADALGELLDLFDLGIVLRQQLGEVRAQLQPMGRDDRQHEQYECSEHDGDRVP